MICVNSVSVTPSSVTLKVGEWFYNAKATVCPANASYPCVTWQSGNPNVASVSESNGYIHAKAAGTAKIYATAIDGSGKSDYITVTVSSTVPVTSITLNKGSMSLEKGSCSTLSATVSPSNATNKALSWTSSNPCVASVSNGTVCALDGGSAVITATAKDGSGVYARCTVTVTEDVLVTSITVEPASYTMLKGQSILPRALVYPANATNNGVVWSSSDSTIATVTPNDGLIQALKEGTVTITATARDGSGVRGACTISVEEIHAESIVVCPEKVTIGIGEVAILHAQPCPENSTDEIVWRSANERIAEVNNGVVRGISGGEAKITAKVSNTVSASCVVTVDPREKVTIKKDGYSFYVEFADGKVWKNIGIDLSNRQENGNQMYPPNMWYENYDNLIEEEKKYLENIYVEENGVMEYKTYSVKQIAYLYLLDPLGIEYYMKHNACDGLEGNSQALLDLKDQVFIEIFGMPEDKPFYFELDDSGNIVYYMNGTNGMDRSKLYSYGEVLFGFHNYFDWNKFGEELLKKLFESIPVVSTLMTAVEICQELFFAGSIMGFVEDEAKSFVDDYVNETIDNIIDRTPLQPLMWVDAIVKTLVQAALDSFVIPNPNDIKIYEKVENQDSYRVVFEGVNFEASMKDIIEYCSAE